MARVDYSGVPTVEPTGTAPDDLQHIEASPNAFGAQLAEGVGAVGQGAIDASKFYGTVAANNATNNFMDLKNQLFYGDATKPAVDTDGNPIMGPGGGPVGQGGYYALRGADAMQAQAGIQKQYDDILAQQRANLKTPESQLQFDTITRRQRTLDQAEMARFADDQQRVWGINTNTNGIALTQNSIVNHLNNPEALALDREQMRSYYVKRATIQFGHDPDVAAAALMHADQDWATKQLTASIGNNDWANAQRVFDENKGLLGSLPNYDALENAVKTGTVNATMVPAADKAIADALAQAKQQVGQVGTGGTGPVSLPQWQSARTAQESHGDYGAINPKTGALGKYQIMPDTGQALAQQAGLGWHPELMTGAAGRTPQGRQYQDALSHIEDQQAWNAGGGDPIKASVYYYGGQRTLDAYNRDTPEQFAANNPKTAAYVEAMRTRLGSGGGDAYPTTTDALRAQMPDALAKAQADAEKLFPNYPDVQDRYVERVRRGLDQQIAQQASQYNIDAHIVQDYIHQNNVMSDAQLDHAPPNIVTAWQSVKDNNPTAMYSIEHSFDANARGRAEGLGAEFKGYLDRVLAPSNDPNRISDPSQVWGVVGAGQDATLTNSGADQLATLSRIRGTPKGEADAAMIRTFIDRMHDSMTYSNPATGLTDPKGEAAFNRFAATVLPELVNSQKQGTLGNILNPQSKDYIGPTANAFLRTPAEIVKDRLHAEGVSWQPKMGETPTTAQGLQMMVAMGKINGDEAAWIATKFGIRMTPPQVHAQPQTQHPSQHPAPSSGMNEQQYHQWAVQHDPLAGAAVGTGQ